MIDSLVLTRSAASNYLLEDVGVTSGMNIDDACCATSNTKEMVQLLIHLTRDFHQLNDVIVFLSVNGNDLPDDSDQKTMTNGH